MKALMNGHEPTTANQTGIVEMVRVALQKKNRVAIIAGFVLGGWIPTTTYLITHFHAGAMPLLWLLVAGGLTYSAMTVFQWARLAFKHPLKALGFVVLLEGAMTFVPDAWIGVPSLALLIVINGLATGSNLVLDRRVTPPRSNLRRSPALVRG